MNLSFVYLFNRPNINLTTFWKSVNFLKFQIERSHVLLTGATGFLGSFILQNLLKNTQVKNYLS